jgi:hypothetical protein
VKYCPKCKTRKPLSDFWKNKTTTDGYQSWCKQCWVITTTNRRNGPNREIELRQRQNRHLVRSFGITLEQYEKLLKTQGGVCAICHQLNPGIRKLSVDHDHKSGQVRGLLCENCNRGIGQLQETASNLLSALAYLANWW